ncbi:MAG: hypothetical protein GYA15_11220 [Leptolinea sp.]|nr:hypothetical protein [Leptolinea sp.]
MGKKPVSLSHILFLVCLVFYAILLSAGYAMIHQWLWLFIVLLSACAWLFIRKYSRTWLPVILLIVSTGLAAGGKLAGIPPVLAITGAGLALAVWDLSLMDAEMVEIPEDDQTRSAEMNHLRSLGLAAGGSVVLISVGHLLHLKMPFFFLVVLILGIILGLDRIWGYLKKKV